MNKLQSGIRKSLHSNGLELVFFTKTLKPPQRHIRPYSSLYLNDAFAGKSVLVTGGSRGIGFAIAELFASLGAKCTIVGRKEETLKQAAQSFSCGHGGQRHNHIVGNVSDAAFWSNIELPEDSSRVDILVNAAGVTHASLLMRTTESCIDEVVQTNLMGTLWACRAISKKMVKQKSESSEAIARGKGCIINVASLLATQMGAGSAAYSASKAGVVGLTRALAAELGGSGIRVNAVLPGYVETDMTDAMAEKAREQALSRIPSKRFGTPNEIAEAVVFLVANGYANNCILNLDGGLSAT